VKFCLAGSRQQDGEQYEREDLLAQDYSPLLVSPMDNVWVV
jgi:hypothetical protein